MGLLKIYIQEKVNTLPILIFRQSI
jgi:hypothetical protein